MYMTTIPKMSHTWLPLALAMTLVACTDDTNFDFEQSIADSQAIALANSAPEALFNPAAGDTPFPNNLLFLGSADGTLNIPLGEGQDIPSNPAVAMNQQTGFSTVASITTPVSKSLLAESVNSGNVRILEVSLGSFVDAQDPVLTGTVASLRSFIDPAVTDVTGSFFVSATDGQVILTPLAPMQPNTSYMVFLTTGVTDDNIEADGTSNPRPLSRSFVYRLLTSDESIGNEELAAVEGLSGEAEAERQATLTSFRVLEALRISVGSQLAAIDTLTGVEASEVALSWVFTTQDTQQTLLDVKGISVASSSFEFQPSDVAASDVFPTLTTVAFDIFEGAIDLPYYLTAVGNDGNPVSALNSFWANADGGFLGAPNASGAPDFTPASTGDVTVPVLLTVPLGDMPAGGWPVTIYQHGITGNRSQMLPTANAMAQAGRAVVAIDMPVHGVDSDNPLFVVSDDGSGAQEGNILGASERTFAIDADQDGIADDSGTHFINLGNLANTRDNLRQAVADLFVLSASLDNATFPEGDNTSFDVSNKSFVGHSLGSIVGTTMLAFDDSFNAATLAMPGGGVAQLLSNSDSFGPVIRAGLAEAGIEDGSADFQQFLIAAQTLVDSGDPINHAVALGTSGNAALHLIEVIGDTVVPNGQFAGPLFGTEPLIRLLGLSAVGADNATSAAPNSAVRFIAGDHGSIIDPTASLDATVEMQTQTASFAATQGTMLSVSDTTVLQETAGELQ